MKAGIYLALGAFFQLLALVIFANDPDQFSVAQLLDVAQFHHEDWELLFLVLSAFFYIVFLRRNRRPSHQGA